MRSPFDEARYKTLLNGLDINIVKLSEVGLRNESFRIDSEYFRRRYFDIEATIAKNKSRRISEFNPSILHPKEIKREYEDGGGVLFFRTQNLRPLRVDLSSQVYISLEDAKTLQNNIIRKNDVLITRTGANFGDALVVVDNFEAIASSHVFIFRNKTVNQAYLAVFLNTKYGREQINRGMYGGVQPEIAPYYLKNILVPDVSDDFQKQIEKTVKAAHAKLEQSKSLYAQAEATLLDELGLKNWKPPKESAAVKSFSESFGKSGRLDAEYYQPKYDVLEKKLSKFEQMTIRDLVNYPVSSGATPKAGGDDYTGEEEGIPFVRAVNLSYSEVLLNDAVYIKPAVHQGILKKTKLKTNDVLLSIAGTVGRCAIYSHEQEANINQALAILRFDEHKVTRLYLSTFFNSDIGTEYIARYGRLGLQTNLNLDEVSSLRIPVIGMKMQKAVSSKMEQSFEARKESKRLLELAKQAVETAIEKGEKAGLKVLG